MSMPIPETIQTVADLNAALIVDDSNRPQVEQSDFSVTDGDIMVHFKNLRANLIRHIRKADAVVGCVAWLTDHKILQALSGKRAVSIIVQKEDFLRPDIGAPPDFRSRLRASYEALPALDLSFGHEPTPGPAVFSTNTHGPISLDPVRCLGHHNGAGHPAWPRMHHKFLVFCEIVETLPLKFEGGEGRGAPAILRPFAVWTGSYNLTDNGSRSFENALHIDRSCVAAAYFREWGQLAALSESLDWTSDWLAPDRSIGS